MTIDIQKAKRALAILQEEKQAQKDRLRRAAKAKNSLNNYRSYNEVSYI